MVGTTLLCNLWGHSRTKSIENHETQYQDEMTKKYWTQKIKVLSPLHNGLVEGLKQPTSWPKEQEITNPEIGLSVPAMLTAWVQPRDETSPCQDQKMKKHWTKKMKGRSVGSNTHPQRSSQEMNLASTKMKTWRNTWPKTWRWGVRLQHPSTWV